MKTLIFVIATAMTLIVCAYFKIENHYVFYVVELSLMYCIVFLFYKIIKILTIEKINNEKAN